MTSFPASFHTDLALQRHERLLAEARHAALVRQARDARRRCTTESVAARAQQVPSPDEFGAGSTIAKWRSRVLRARNDRRRPSMQGAEQ